MTADPNALKNVFNLSFKKKKNQYMSGKILLYGLQCSLEPMLALMALITVYFQKHTQVWFLHYFTVWHADGVSLALGGSQPYE